MFSVKQYGKIEDGLAYFKVFKDGAPFMHPKMPAIQAVVRAHNATLALAVAERLFSETVA